MSASSSTCSEEHSTVVSNDRSMSRSGLEGRLYCWSLSSSSMVCIRLFSARGGSATCRVMSSSESASSSGISRIISFSASSCFFRFRMPDVLSSFASSSICCCFLRDIPTNFLSSSALTFSPQPMLRLSSCGAAAGASSCLMDSAPGSGPSASLAGASSALGCDALRPCLRPARATRGASSPVSDIAAPYTAKPHEAAFLPSCREFSVSVPTWASLCEYAQRPAAQKAAH
mmetsp:Transcript_10270/g.26147  ORF Transcript_10270/g.26147 Transcript_10270/m.26147 type:complete len:230 (-) Transcript_10270:211-900(-)